MNTEHLHETLSRQAYADLREGLKRRAEQERRALMQHFGLTKADRQTPRAAWFDVLNHKAPHKA